MLRIKQASLKDIDRMMEIYHSAQERMIASGNPNQWGRSYPARELILEDIRKGMSYLVYEGDRVHAVFVLQEGEDPSYRVIEEGKWLNDEAYVTIHRIASDGEVHGVFWRVFEYCRERSENVRVDTHRDNRIMQHQAETCGFQYCGIIYVRDHSPRLAYHWNIREAENRKEKEDNS